MNEKLSDKQRLAEEAARMLAANPDLVFDERIRIDIPGEDAEFWLKFASEWGGALYLLDETNKKRYEKQLIEPAQYEYARRTYRLGLIALSQLYDLLKAWNEGEDRSLPFVYVMSSLDCYFIPAYLEDFSRVQPSLKNECDCYVRLVMDKLASKASIDDAISALQTMVGEYIRNIHVYAK
ncbi:hypothetical protein [Paenibacillus sp. MBLB4367]|uniref:hypothetical protein n=1 Tax=Paenibacillus sp. MBLB4367 TaxID=3384767 RepID=UPI003908228A